LREPTSKGRKEKEGEKEKSEGKGKGEEKTGRYGRRDEKGGEGICRINVKLLPTRL